MTSSRSDHLFLLKFFFNFAVMDSIFHGNLDDVLSRCTEFDHMEGKFTASKTTEISPRIAKLQANLGFAPGESLTSDNLHRLIPAAKDIHCIIGRRRCHSPVRNVQEKKSPNQPRFAPYIRDQRPKHVTNKKLLPAMRRIKNDLKHSLGVDDSSKSNMGFDSKSKKDFPTSNMNKSFGESFLNKSLPHLSKNFSDSRSRKSWDASKSHEKSGFLNSNKGMNIFRSMKDFSDSQRNTDIGPRTLNKEIDSWNSRIGVGTLKKKANSLNTSRAFSEFSLTGDQEVPNSSMDFDILNTKKYLPVSKLSKSSDTSYINRNVSLSVKNISVSKLNSFGRQRTDSILSDDLEVSSEEDEKENLHEIVF